MTPFLDIFQQQFNKAGEELCGDTVRIGRTATHTILVLSDGLGSGVKANILSTMTAAILLTMLSADAPLDETVRTVIGTLPVCQVRKLAYATFTVVRIDNATGYFRVVNFDNPRIVWIKGHALQTPSRQFQQVLDHQVAVFDGTLEEGDFLGILSDGILHAGLGATMNLGWGWDNVASYLEQSLAHYAGNSRGVVQRVMAKVQQLYSGKIGDDCTLIGLLTRQKRRVTVFTGPPLDRTIDETIVSYFLSLPGRHVVCGGTTGNIVARLLDETPAVVIESIRPDVPPIAELREIDLMTEGMLTLNKTTEILRSTTHPDGVPEDKNGAALLARELLNADSIRFIAGQKINDFYQNPTLPVNLSLRKNLVNEMARLLKDAGKEVVVEWC